MIVDLYCMVDGSDAGNEMIFNLHCNRCYHATITVNAITDTAAATVAPLLVEPLQGGRD
jgi:hypothetical protein